MKVFVSGTTGDLGRFRKAAAEQLIRLGGEAIEQTYFGVDHRTLPTLLKDKVKSCDAVICFVGPVFGAAPPGSIRSYTQMEYDFAQEFGKPIFLLFPSTRCRLDGEEHDTPEQRDLQSKHTQRIRSSTHIWYEFDDETQVRLITAEAVFKISPEAAGGKIARAVRTDFPTPLALLYDDCIGSEQPHLLRLLIAESLRFLSLLALHDSVVHRSFGCQSADTEKRIQTLARPAKLSDWHSLLRLACPDEGARGDARFITEFAGWEERNCRSLSNVVQAEETLSQRRIPDLLQIVGRVRESLSAILADLDFLRRYVLLAVSEANPQTGKCSARILRGLAPRPFKFVMNLQSPLLPLKNQMYLLSVDRRRALCLLPSFSCECREEEERVYGWAALCANHDSTLHVELAPFDDHDAITVPENPDTRVMLTDWLGGEICQHAFGFQTQSSPIVREGKLLDDESWEMLQKVVLPEGGEQLVLGGRFRVEASPVHRGFHADVFDATDIADKVQQSDTGGKAATVPTLPEVHVLRVEGAADEQVRSWFQQRSGCWRRVEHPGVLRLYEPGDPAGKRGLPFLLTDRVPGARSLEQLVQSGEGLSDTTVMDVIALAAEVCRTAHQQGIFLLALPLRHFLMDDGGNLHLTGFDAAVCADPGGEFPSSLLNHLRRFSKDLDMMAPEVRRELGTFAPTLDVFGIGALLARLRGMPMQPMDMLPPSAWPDPWRCLAFHCLAADPNMRFQSADQVLLFLKEWSRQDIPQTVTIPSPTVTSGFSIAKFPVTNREYGRFCREKNHPFPPHLSDRDLRDQDRDECPWRRLSGPWLPVTHVNLLDAEAYCHWLTNKTSKTWRLPTESEWIRAASGQKDRQYPWGDECPDRVRANFDRFYRGPTVIGAFPDGRSPTDCWDLAGNVWEWCSDIVTDGAPRRVLKGGAYGYSSETLRLTCGHAVVVTCRSPHLGFRVLCEEPR